MNKIFKVGLVTRFPQEHYSRKFVRSFYKFPFIDEFKNGVDALLVKPFDSSELANAIIKLLQNDELKHKLSENIKRKKNNRDWNSIAQILFEKAYLKCLK